MKKHAILITVLLFLIVMAFAVTGKDKEQDPGQMKMERPMMKDGMGPHQGMQDMLKLTDDQKKQVQTIMTSHKKDMNTMKADLDNLQIDKQNLLSQQKFDEAKNIVDQINAKQAQMEKSGIDCHKQMWNILTDDQKKIAKENKMGPGMGMMDGDRPGPGGKMGPKGMKGHKMGQKGMEGCDGNCDMPGKNCK